MYSIAFEGARLAIKKGGWPLTPEKIKAGLEAMKDFNANGLMAPVTVTAAGPWRRRQDPHRDVGRHASGCRRPTGSPASPTRCGNVVKEQFRRIRQVRDPKVALDTRQALRQIISLPRLAQRKFIPNGRCSPCASLA